MTAIKTKRNWVCAYDRRPGDVLVQVNLLGPVGDGTHLRPIILGRFPITTYDEWVDWAVAIADNMAHPIHVLPLNHNDFFLTGRFDPYRKVLENLTDQEWGEMRLFLVDNCAELMRDDDDPAIRDIAYKLLVQLQAVRPISTHWSPTWSPFAPCRGG